ncbi:branched-chain amino acid aminotransferase 2 [Quercus suber]|uniref:Branched-chain amino acid aminotransferase 2 n=1 Tax=Quercus suber TaxID=58331 RepID=A0AAW0JYY0_QUESU
MLKIFNTDTVLLVHIYYQMEERVIPVEELMDADEVFCTGTAVVVNPVGSVTYRGSNRKQEWKQHPRNFVGCNNLKDTRLISRQNPYVCLEYARAGYRTATCRDPTVMAQQIQALIANMQELMKQNEELKRRTRRETPTMS